jgi:hypothetical protein
MVCQVASLCVGSRVWRCSWGSYSAHCGSRMLCYQTLWVSLLGQTLLNTGASGRRPAFSTVWGSTIVFFRAWHWFLGGGFGRGVPYPPSRVDGRLGMPCPLQDWGAHLWLLVLCRVVSPGFSMGGAAGLGALRWHPIDLLHQGSCSGPPVSRPLLFGHSQGGIHTQRRACFGFWAFPGIKPFSSGAHGVLREPLRLQVTPSVGKGVRGSVGHPHLFP